MHKPFDLEAAKAGEPIEYLGLSDRWGLCRFLGISESGDGYFVIERINGKGFQLSYASHGDLRMAPKKVTVRYRNYKLVDAGRPAVSMICDEPGWDSVEEIEKKSWFRGWIHADWQEVEVPQ